jgi:Ca2+-binding RTX toxin-like protein
LGDQVKKLTAGAYTSAYEPETGVEFSASTAPKTPLFLAAATDGPLGVTLTGGSDGDFLRGTADNDDIYGLGGNDTLYGAAGSDRLWGGDGTDVIYGGLGDDQIWGEDGNDNIRDEDGGNDRLYGGAGEDTVYVVRTNSSAETVLLDGGEGHDRLYYWGGTYTSNGTSLVYGAGQMLGGAGDDFISAYMVGAVTIDAGDGNDLVEFGLGGLLTISLGAGVDVLNLEQPRSNTATMNVITVTDFQAGDGGDRINLPRMLQMLGFSWGGLTNPFADHLIYLVQEGADTVIKIAGTEPFATVMTLRNVQMSSLTAENFNGWPPDGSAPPGITFTGSARADALTGSPGGDHMLGGAGDDQMTGGAGADRIEGGDGADLLYGDAGDDIVYGGAGRDQIEESVGSTGNDTYYGGDDGDRFVIYRPTANTNTINAYGEAGDDRLDVRTAESTGLYSTLLFDGGAGDDVASIGAIAHRTFNGGDGDDALTLVPRFADGRSQFGDGVFQGGAGFDTVAISGILATAITGSGTTITVGDVVLHDIEALQLSGSQGAVFDLQGLTTALNVRGGSGADTLRLGSGDDVITGGMGNDTLDGGAGTDTAVYESFFGDAVLSFAGGTVTVNASLWGEGVDTLTNIEQIQFIDGLYIVGSAFNGTAGADTISGSANGEILTGLDGADILNGLGGDDILLGGRGADTLTGGAGADIFRYLDVLDSVAAYGIDTITDFQSGIDKIDLSRVTGLSNAPLTITQSGGVSTVTWGSLVVKVTGTVVESDLIVTRAVSAVTLTGTAAADTLQGTAGADTLYGAGGDDVLNGYAGDDMLIGGSGNDIMAGGGGNDTYEVAEAGDAVIENPGEGTDTVFSYLDGYRLAANVETLRLVGSARVGYGNALDNVLVGNALDNTLVGGAGNDTLMGGAGNDAYEVTEAGDVVVEGASEGSDIVFSYLDSYALTANVENLALIGTAREAYGNALANTLIGNALDNRMIGGAGADLMIGGAGNDAYEVTETGDAVVENAGEGIDTVYAYVDYALAANVEVLALIGSARVGYGNALDNTLIGNGLDNVLIGGAGNDTMIGGAGNDAYEVTEAGDVVTELAGGGTDTVYSYLNSYTLTDNVETLNLVGGAVNGFGNGGDNRLIGNGLDNLLNGGAGNDVLIGGAGADTMIGGAGNDAYEVTEAGDVVTELAGGGTDTVYSYLDAYQLTDNAEVLALAGAGRVALGNAGNNTLIGNALANVLNGNGGDDVLTGGAGADTFWHLGAAAGNDRITDFQTASEVIVLDSSVYANFAAVQSHAAQVGGNVVITLNASTSLTLENVQLNQLSAGNFVFFAAGATEPVEKEVSPEPLTQPVEGHDLFDAAVPDAGSPATVGGYGHIPLHLLADGALPFEPANDAPWTLPHNHWA